MSHPCPHVKFMTPLTRKTPTDIAWLPLRRREGMTWGENRLALLVHAPNCLVWTVRESQVTSTTWHREKMGKKKWWNIVGHLFRMCMFSVLCIRVIYTIYMHWYICFIHVELFTYSCPTGRERERERNIDGSYLKVNMYHIVHNLLSYSISVICLRWLGFLLLTSMGRFFPHQKHESYWRFGTPKQQRDRVLAAAWSACGRVLQGTWHNGYGWSRKIWWFMLYDIDSHNHDDDHVDNDDHLLYIMPTFWN